MMEKMLCRKIEKLKYFFATLLRGHFLAARFASHSSAGRDPENCRCVCKWVWLVRCKSSPESTLSDSVIDCYCVAARRGGELQEVNEQSATKVNSIRSETRRACRLAAKPKAAAKPSVTDAE